MDRLLWFVFTDHLHRDWTVWLASRLQCEALTGCVGITFFESREIYIDVTQHRKEQDETLQHEMFHAHLLAERGRFRSVPASSAEERLIRKLSPAYYKTAARHGLKWPPRPAGYASLARSARRRHNEAEEAE